MTKTLSMPPDGYVRIETDVLFDSNLPNAARVTYIQLRALAWGRTETPPFSPAEFEALTGTGRSTLYGHLKLLRTCDDLRWRTLSDATMVVSFTAAATSEPEQARLEEAKPETPVQKSGQSRNLDSSLLDHSDQKLSNQKDKTVASRNLDESRKLDSEIFEALADVSGRTPSDRDWKKLPGVTRGILNKAASQLRKVKATPEQVRDFWPWWKVHDFRGRQNKRPDPWEVVKQWTVYLNSQNGQDHDNSGIGKDTGTGPDAVRIRARVESIQRRAAARAGQDMPALPPAASAQASDV
jgi:hypothetical protein